MSVDPKLDAYRDAVVLARYGKDNTTDIAADLGMRTGGVIRRANRLWLDHAGNQKRQERNDSFDIHYFDEWSPNMAYILGFWFADGSVSKGRIGVQISQNDEPLLQWIRKELKAKKELARDEGRGKRGPAVSLRLHSMVTAKRLNELGLLPNKTFRNDPFPNVPEDLLGHFIRGVLDGDGSICVGQRRCHAKIVGPPAFISGLGKLLADKHGVSLKNLTVVEGKRASWSTIDWTLPNDLRILYRLLYPEGYGFCLERKRTRLFDWLMEQRVEMRVWDNNAKALGFTEPLSLGERRKQQ